MKVDIIRCGPFVNESEEKALTRLQSELQKQSGNDRWILMSNVVFSVSNQLQSDEIDIIAIGPPGIRLIEVKHWSDWEKNDVPDHLVKEAEKVTSKCKRMTSLRKIDRDLPYIGGVILLTQEPSKIKKLLKHGNLRGVPLHSLSQWKGVIGFEKEEVLSPNQIERLAKAIAPDCGIKLDGTLPLRRLAGYVNLELQTPPEEKFHRVYRGQHASRRDRVVLHLYDLSAIHDKNAKEKAERENRILHKLWQYPWAPKITDSFQEVPGYIGELYFLTVSDPTAPTVERKSEDSKWSTEQRLCFVRETLKAVDAFHKISEDDNNHSFLIHRNLNPKTVFVTYDDKPILAGYDFTKIPGDLTVAPSKNSASFPERYTAPEVLRDGLSAADQRSDIYSICRVLADLFDENDSSDQETLALLEEGLNPDPKKRPPLSRLIDALKEESQDIEPLEPELLPARFWSEGMEISDSLGTYKIVESLGKGGIGATFKVVEISPETREEFGTYVAKVIFNRDLGKSILDAYRSVRQYLDASPGLSTIYAIRNQYEEERIIAVLKWVEGIPLAEYKGLLPMLQEEMQEESPESLVLRLFCEVCESLSVLHQKNLVHGDVSPKNLIVSGQSLVLTDYDLVTQQGKVALTPGTTLYSSQERVDGKPCTFSDDLFALAASFFQVLFDREPFLDRRKGFHWEGIDCEGYSKFRKILDKAVNPDIRLRYSDAMQCQEELRAVMFDGNGNDQVNEPGAAGFSAPVLGDRTVNWLKDVLQSYPGSKYGNAETRGLDSSISEKIYVPTPLENALYEDITNRQVRLVILCGNAGDGKTALLQHLFKKLVPNKECHSSHRILKGRTSQGLTVRMNLDGSASWKDQSADELLDRFLEPFQSGEPSDDIVHLLAVNDGRLLEWLDHSEDVNDGTTVLAEKLKTFLETDGLQEESLIRFINLNQRSLVGDIRPDQSEIDISFLNDLVDQLYGGNDTATNWAPCPSCTKNEHCPVFNAGRLFGPGSFPEAFPEEKRNRARRQLFDCFQAVHFRGVTHITIRELRAALTYILFGIHYCDDYHENVGLVEYWDRVFCSDSPSRQGEVLQEIARFDPAIEVHPKVDRYLFGSVFTGKIDSIARYPNLPLESARRRAYFEWSEAEILKISGEIDSKATDALGLAQGETLDRFRRLPLETDNLETVEQLCRGISRLENLPSISLQSGPKTVPLRLPQRTMTDTFFWVEKSLERFEIEPILPREEKGIGRLHRRVKLLYHCDNGSIEELNLGLELFQLLLKLAEGYQLGDISTDDTFANLSIFTRRLTRENERTMLAWNPMDDEEVYRIDVEKREINGESKQCISIRKTISVDGGVS